MKRILSLVIVGILLFALIPVPAFGEYEGAPSSPLSRQTQTAKPTHPDPPGELMIVDALIMRPLGVAACIVGMVGAFLSWPFAATSNSPNPVGRQLLVKPFRWTFERPLGQMDYPDSTDDHGM
jgi:hypothetical protein